MTVVRIDAGREAVRAYVTEQADRGLAHVIALLRADLDHIAAAVDGLSEEEGTRVTLEGEWTPAEVLAHLNTSLERSHARLATMSSGHEWTNPPVVPGQTRGSDGTFEGLRQEYLDGMHAIIEVLERADEGRGRELIAEHAQFGPFDWLQWAVYSHHVHTWDHIGQLREARERVRPSS